MSSRVVRAYIHYYDDHGRRTEPAKRIFALLCEEKNKDVLDISVPDKYATKFKSIRISRAELERVLAVSRPARRGDAT